MTIALTTPISQGILLRDVSWDLYERMLEETEGQHLRITFDEGRMELMSPTPRHEQIKKLLGTLVEMIAVERDIPVAMFGSTTFRNPRLQAGLEPDECYYIQNESAVRNRERLKLDDDPPPDLVIEVDITHHAIDRESIYARMGVQEIWRHDGQTLEALGLRGTSYEPITYSIAFPFLKVAELDRFVRMVPAIGHIGMLRRFRRWVAEPVDPDQRG